MRAALPLLFALALASCAGEPPPVPVSGPPPADVAPAVTEPLGKGRTGDGPDAPVAAEVDGIRAAAVVAQAAAVAAQGLAETARTGAETARTGAETARTGAETAQTAAETARTGAETARTGAETARTGSETAKTASEAAAAVAGGANKAASRLVHPSAPDTAQSAALIAGQFQATLPAALLVPGNLISVSRLDKNVAAAAPGEKYQFVIRDETAGANLAFWKSDTAPKDFEPLPLTTAGDPGTVSGKWSALTDNTSYAVGTTRVLTEAVFGDARGLAERNADGALDTRLAAAEAGLAPLTCAPRGNAADVSAIPFFQGLAFPGTAVGRFLEARAQGTVTIGPAGASNPFREQEGAQTVTVQPASTAWLKYDVSDLADGAPFAVRVSSLGAHNPGGGLYSNSRIRFNWSVGGIVGQTGYEAGTGAERVRTLVANKPAGAQWVEVGFNTSNNDSGANGGAGNSTAPVEFHAQAIELSATAPAAFDTAATPSLRDEFDDFKDGVGLAPPSWLVLAVWGQSQVTRIGAPDGTPAVPVRAGWNKILSATDPEAGSGTISAATLVDFADDLLPQTTAGGASGQSLLPAFCEYVNRVLGLGVVVVFSAKGNTAADADADTGAGNWEAGGALRTALLAKVARAEALVTAAGYDVALAVGYRMQGGADAQAIEDATITEADYQAAVESEVAAVSSALEAEFPGRWALVIGKTVVHVNELRDNPASKPGWKAVRAVQEAVANASARCLGWVHPLEFTGERGGLSDNVHGAAFAQQVHGRVVAAKISEGVSSRPS